MPDKEKIKDASNNAVDFISKLGKQFLNEAIEHGEPILDLLNQLSEGKDKSKSAESIFNLTENISINKLISYTGTKGIYHALVEDKTGFTLLFLVPGVNKLDLVLEKNDDSVEVFCKTSIGDSRIQGFRYKEKEIKFNLKFTYDIQCHNVLAELKDGLLKINLEKPFSKDDDEIITVV
tara:strand:+ start:1299 stop:1832 length:534 start_codon:yes stop_codon:yes gene_type:complete